MQKRSTLAAMSLRRFAEGRPTRHDGLARQEMVNDRTVATVCHRGPVPDNGTQRPVRDRNAFARTVRQGRALQPMSWYTPRPSAAMRAGTRSDRCNSLR